MLVRVYVTESRARIERVLELLHGSEKVRGITVFRGVAGFGTTPITNEEMREPIDPPMVLEFFDKKAAAIETVRYLRTLVSPHHVVMWPIDMLEIDG